MSHEVEIVDGVAKMIYVGPTPWHGHGIKLDAPPSVEDATRLSGLNTHNVLVPTTVHLPGVHVCELSGDVVTPDGTLVGNLTENKFSVLDSLVLDSNGKPIAHVGESLHVPTGEKAVVRTSDMSVLGNVGQRYEIVQNKDLFSFFNPVIEGGYATIETAGSLREGRRVWMLAKILGTDAEIVPGDPVSAYFMLSGTHDGTGPCQVGRTGVRVVCQNTLSQAHRNGKDSLLKVRHTKNANYALQQIGELLDKERMEFALNVEQMKTLARKSVTGETLKAFIREVFELEIGKRALKNADKPFEKLEAKIIPLFENGKGNTLAGARGTLWAAYNAVTEYHTWEHGRNTDNRLESLWFGEKKATNNRAFEVALKMAA